jgi:hypothetical protein
MTKTKLLYAAIIVLILLNLGQWFFLRKGGKHRPEPKNFIINKLNLSATQIADYDKIIQYHRKNIAQNNELLRKQKNELYQLLKTPNEAEEPRLFAEIAATQMSIEKLHFEHFLAIKALCSTEQQPLFNDLVADLGKLFSPPPPPKK